MNHEYVASLERIAHSSNISIKQLLQKQNALQKLIVALQTENKQLRKLYEFEKEKYICNICFQNQKDCIIKPCYHFVGCQKCSTKLYKCPVCRESIDSFINLFVS